MTITGILLAAGRGTRFGGNKLEADFRGEMLGLHAARTLGAVGCAHLIAVHDPENTALANGLRGQGFTLIDNHDPSAGLAHSLKLATRWAMATTTPALLVCLGDMPFICTDHLSALMRAHQAHPAEIIASKAANFNAPPAIFPKAIWPQLLAMQGDAGARTMLKHALCMTTTTHELTDIDSRDMLAALQISPENAK